jgi:hypothetical protein
MACVRDVHADGDAQDGHLRKEHVHQTPIAINHAWHVNT